MAHIFTTRGLAELLNAREWQVRRLFEDGTLPEPTKFGGKRAIPSEMIPTIIDALRARGWLPASMPTTGRRRSSQDAGDAGQSGLSRSTED